MRTKPAPLRIAMCEPTMAPATLHTAIGNVLFGYALPMAVCNVAGAMVGSHIAMRKGAGFVRILFLLLVSVLILKLAYDMLK